MPEAESSTTEPESSGPQAKDIAAVAQVLSAAAAEISAEAEEGDRRRLDAPPVPAVSPRRPSAPMAVVRRRRDPVRQPRAVTQSQRASVSVNPTAFGPV